MNFSEADLARLSEDDKNSAMEYFLRAWLGRKARRQYDDNKHQQRLDRRRDYWLRSVYAYLMGTSMLNKLEDRRKKLHDYIIMKLDEHDYHAVADAAMDLRELMVEIRFVKQLQPIEMESK